MKKFPGTYLVTHTGKYGARRRIGRDAVTGKDRQERREGFETAREAFEWKNSVSAGRARNRVVPTRITVTELLETDISTQLGLGRIRTSTADTYRRHGETVKPVIGSLRASELTARDLDKLYGDLGERL